MIGAVFGKGARAVAGGGHQNQPRHHQGSPAVPGTPQGLEDREKIRPSNLHHENPPDHGYRLDPGGVVAPSNNNYPGTNPPHSYASGAVGDDVVTSHDYFAQAQQQNYYSSQHQVNPQQIPPPYYAGQPQPGYHQPQPVPYERSISSLSHDVNHREHPAVGVMYERPGNPPVQKKSIFPGRATARGAALISSMRNLTLAGALRGGKKEVNDWEKQWDADEDDDSDEEDEDETGTPSDGTSTGVRGGSTSEKPSSFTAQSAPLHYHGQVRPAMDAGHSELPMQPHVQSGAMEPTVGGPSVPIESASTLQNFNSGNNKVAFVTHDLSAVHQHQQQQDLAAEWDMAGIQPPSAIVDDQETTSTTVQTTLPQQQREATKPNVQMFLPMLRVLGKGSFGKVSGYGEHFLIKV